MAWWKSNEKDDVIGDGAADIITQVCRDINSLYRDQGGVPPQIGEFLVILADACNKCVELGLVDSPMPISKLKAIYHGETEESLATEPPSILAHELGDLIMASLKLLSGDYQNSMDRIPRVSEVFACFSFVLGYRPEDYLSEMEGKSVAVIEPTI